MKYPVIVSSCAAYSDCWGLLINSLEKHVNFDLFYVIIVTDYVPTGCLHLQEYPSVDFYITENSNWSESLEIFFNGLFCETFLYIQEDYFLLDFNNEYIHSVFKETKYDCYYLNKRTVDTKKYLQSEDNLMDVRPASLQAAVWNRSVFLNLLGKYRTPWLFEIWGTVGCKLLSVTSVCSSIPLINYTFTAVNRGKWSDEGIRYMAEYGFSYDLFIRRGQYHPNFYSDKLNLINKTLNFRSEHVRHAATCTFKLILKNLRERLFAIQ